MTLEIVRAETINGTTRVIVRNHYEAKNLGTKANPHYEASDSFRESEVMCWTARTMFSNHINIAISEINKRTAGDKMFDEFVFEAPVSYEGLIKDAIKLWRDRGRIEHDRRNTEWAAWLRTDLLESIRREITP